MCTLPTALKVERLLDRGVPVNVRDSFGNTVLCVVRRRLVRPIFRGIESFCPLFSSVTAALRAPFTSLLTSQACQNGLKRIAKTCLRRGADINAKNYKVRICTHDDPKNVLLSFRLISRHTPPPLGSRRRATHHFIFVSPTGTAIALVSI